MKQDEFNPTKAQIEQIAEAIVAKMGERFIADSLNVTIEQYIFWDRQRAVKGNGRWAPPTRKPPERRATNPKTAKFARGIAKSEQQTNKRKR